MVICVKYNASVGVARSNVVTNHNLKFVLVLPSEIDFKICENDFRVFVSFPRCQFGG